MVWPELHVNRNTGELRKDETEQVTMRLARSLVICTAQ